MKIKKLLSAFLAIMTTASLLVTAVHAEEEEDDGEVVFVPREYETYHGEIPSMWDEVWNMEGYQWDEYIKLDGEKDKVYDYGLILNVDQLIDGEETGTSAKVYLLYDMCLRVFVEVTDSELVEPSSDRQHEDPKGVDAIDCVEFLLDPEEEYRGQYRENPESGKYEWIEEMGPIMRLYRFDWTGFGYSRWTDRKHSAEVEWLDNKEDGRFFTGADMYGSGGTLDSVCKPLDENDPDSGVVVKETENGYNFETVIFLTQWGGETVYGLEVILNDVYDGGNKTSSYSTNASLNKDNVLDYKQWNGVTFAQQSLLDTNKEVLALYDPAFQTGDVSANDSETSADTETVMPDTAKDDTASKTADEAGGNGGGLSSGAIAAFVISGVLILIVIVVLLIRRDRKNER